MVLENRGWVSEEPTFTVGKPHLKFEFGTFGVTTLAICCLVVWLIFTVDELLSLLCVMNQSVIR